MKGRTQTRTFTRHQKLAILGEWQQGKQAAVVAKRHNIPQQYLYAWKKDLLASNSGTAVAAQSNVNTGTDAARLEMACAVIGHMVLDQCAHGVSPPVIIERLRSLAPQQMVSSQNGSTVDAAIIPSQQLTSNVHGTVGSA